MKNKVILTWGISKNHEADVQLFFDENPKIQIIKITSTISSFWNTFDCSEVLNYFTHIFYKEFEQ